MSSQATVASPLRGALWLLGVYAFAAGCGAATDLDFPVDVRDAMSGGTRPAGTGGVTQGASGARGAAAGWVTAGTAPVAGWHPGTGAVGVAGHGATVPYGGRRPIPIGGYGATVPSAGRPAIAGMGAYYPYTGGRYPVGVGGRMLPPPAGYPGYAGRAAAGFGGVHVVPIGWNCPLAFYDAYDGCDCNCGAWDPDCSQPAQPVLNCAPGQTCVAPGVCGTGAWTCPRSFYGTRDGCDCNCGSWDPDCNDPNQQVFNCAMPEMCVYPGVCAGLLDD